MTITTECKCCGKEFSWDREPGVRGRHRRHCSTKCAALWASRNRSPRMGKVYHRECLVCQKPFETKLHNHMACSLECQSKWTNYQHRQRRNNPMGVAKCEHCNNPFDVTINKRRFCGKSCSNTFAIRKRHPSHAPPTVAELLNSNRMQRIRSQKRRCVRCSHAYLATQPQRMCLCVSCKAEYWKRTPPNPEGYVYCCERCNRMVVRRRMAGASVVCMACSKGVDREMRNESKRRREYLKRSNTKIEGKRFKREDILKRDGMTCRLCGCGVIKTKESVPNQATVDHIIPLAKGGPHTLENCQCACRACNVAKSDTMPERQSSRIEISHFGTPSHSETGAGVFWPM